MTYSVVVLRFYKPICERQLEVIVSALMILTTQLGFLFLHDIEQLSQSCSVGFVGRKMLKLKLPNLKS